MGHIFISYSSKDAAFALQLAASLEPFYDIWIDKDDIKGGSEWEKMIQTAIADCEICLIIVSDHSNESNWVMRETILADNLKKFRVPLLLDGNMPFRLLELQYIDFRADYSGGLRDLLSVLQTQIKPSQSPNTNDEIERLIGAGVLAYFEKDVLAANNLFGQVAILQAALEEKISVLNNWLKSRYSPSSADQALFSEMIQQITILEKAKISGQSLYDDSQTYEWSLELDEAEETLNKIEYVKYILHPTFAQPERIVRDRNSKFKLESVGWGVFTVNIEVHFVDGSLAKTSHDLTFESALD